MVGDDELKREPKHAKGRGRFAQKPSDAPVGSQPYKGRAGRPLALTPDAIKNFLTLIRLGGNLKDACTYAGFDFSTYSKYEKHARQGKEPFHSFFKQIEEAKVELKARILRTVTLDSQQPDVDIKTRAENARWLLERRFRDEYGRHQAVALAAKHEGQIVTGPSVNVDDLAAAILAAEAAATAAASAPDDDVPTLDTLPPTTEEAEPAVRAPVMRRRDEDDEQED